MFQANKQSLSVVVVPFFQATHFWFLAVKCKRKKWVKTGHRIGINGQDGLKRVIGWVETGRRKVKRVI